MIGEENDLFHYEDFITKWDQHANVYVYKGDVQYEDIWYHDIMIFFNQDFKCTQLII